MTAPSHPQAEPVPVHRLRRDVQARLGIVLAADSAAGRPRMSADRQRHCTVELVRQAVAAHSGRSDDRGAEAGRGQDEQKLEMEVLRAQFGFSGLRRLLADFGPSDACEDDVARTTGGTA